MGPVGRLCRGTIGHVMDEGTISSVYTVASEQADRELLQCHDPVLHGTLTIQGYQACLVGSR